MPVDVPGRSNFWVYEIEQLVEMQKKLGKIEDKIAAFAPWHGGEEAEGVEGLTKLESSAGLGTNICSISVFIHILME